MFFEYRMGAVDEIARRLEAASVKFSLDTVELSDPFLGTIKLSYAAKILKGKTNRARPRFPTTKHHFS